MVIPLVGSGLVKLVMPTDGLTVVDVGLRLGHFLMWLEFTT